VDQLLNTLKDDKDLFISIGIAALAFFAMRMLPRLMAGVPFINPAKVKEEIDAGGDMLVLDVRTLEEFRSESGHVPGALNLPLGGLRQRIDSIKGDLAGYADTPVYVMCRTVNRASSAAKMLKGAGLTKVMVVDGGITKWNRMGLPTSRGA